MQCAAIASSIYLVNPEIAGTIEKGHRMNNPLSSLRVRALLILAAVFAVMSAMNGYHILVERQQAIDLAQVDLLHHTETFVAEHNRIVARADQYLTGLTRLPEIQAIAATLAERKSAPETRCSRLLATHMDHTLGTMTVGIAAVNGDVVCHALQPATPVNIADRSYFIEALKTRERVISDLIVSRVNHQPVVVMARALRDPLGFARGVMWIALDLQWLEAEIAHARLPDRGTVGLLDARGIVLVRYPDPQRWIGADVSDVPVFKTILAMNGMRSTEGVGLDRKYKLYAFAPFAETVGGRIALWISVPKDAVTAHIESESAWAAAITTALLLLTFGMVWIGGERSLLRPVSLLSDAARRLAGGDLNARAGFGAGNDELGRLARAFDDMAASIKAKETLLARSNRALRVLSSGNQALLHASGEANLLQDMCQAMVEAGGYRMVCIAYATADGIRPAALWGAEEGRMEETQVAWLKTMLSHGAVQEAIHGTARVVHAATTDPGSAPWTMQGSDIAAALLLPLQKNGDVSGALLVFAREPDAFADEEVKLLKEAADDLAFGIATHRTRVKRAQLEASLKTAEERFRAAADANLDALLILRSVRDGAGNIVDFEFTDINSSAEKMLGMPRDKVIGERLGALRPDQKTGGFIDRYAQVVNSKTPLEEEFRSDTPAAGATWLRHQVVAVGDGVAVSSRDVTAWKQVEDRLRESEFRYRQLFDANPLPMVVCDVATLKIIMANDAVVNHYGYTRDEFLAMGIPDVLLPDDVPRLMEYAARVEHGKLNEAGVWKNRKKDGTLIDVEVTSHAFDFGGRLAAVVMVHDVTEQRRVEAERQRSEERFRTLFEQSPVGVAIIDIETLTPVHFNSVAHQQLGYSREEFARLRVPDYEALEDIGQIRAHEQAFLQKGGDDFETQHRTKSGECRNVHVMLRVLEFADRRSVYCIYQDITEQKKSKMALQRANRALRTLSATNEELVRATNEQDLLQAVCRIIVDQGGYDGAKVAYAQRDAEKSIKPMAWAGLDEHYVTHHAQTWADTAAGQRPVSRAIRNGRREIARNIRLAAAFSDSRDEIARMGYSSNVALPLFEGSRVLGALNIYASEAEAFDDEEIHLLEQLASDLSYGIATLRTKAERDRIAHEHLHHHEILRKSLEESIQAIAHTVEMRDPYTAGHQRRVGDLAAAIAHELGLDEEQTHGIRLAASIHDLGKVKIPAEILSNPGALTDIERKLVQMHAQGGYDILKGIAYPWPIATMVWQHHERLDGSGYPQGLKNGEILLESRIIAVADVVEAMASHRPYRPAKGIHAGMAELERGRGTLYDAAVVDACLRLVRENRFSFSA